MKAECIECLVACNREIEFTYQRRRFSITYQELDGAEVISVCEYNKKPIHVKTATDVLNLRIGNISLEKIFASLPDSAFDIF